MILASGSKNYVTAQFDLLTEDWTAPITAIFNEYTVVLDENNQCLVPWEVLANPGKVAVSAFCGDLHTATSVLVPVHPGGYIDGQTPQPPTPGVYEQLLGMVQTAVDTANDVKERADAGEFNGKDAPQIDDTQASPDHPWSGAKVDQEVKQLSEQIKKVNKEVADAREGYFGEQYDSLCERIDGDINNVLDKVNVMAYEGTSFHATNTYARNLNVNRNKVEILGQTIQNCLDHSSADKFALLGGSINDGYIIANASGDEVPYYVKKDSIMLKPGTNYTFVVEIAETSLEPADNAIVFGESWVRGPQPSLFANYKLMTPTIGVHKFVLKTKDTFDGAMYGDRSKINATATSGSIKLRYMIIEGDWTNKDVSWVPFGLNTPQTTELHMVGKNLAKSFDAPLSTTRYGRALVVDAYFTPNTRYSLLIEGNSEDTFYTNEFLFIEDGNFRPGTVVQVTTKSYIDLNSPNVFDPSRNKFIITKNAKDNSGDPFSAVYVYRGESITDKEPYTENTVTIDKPLGSVSETIRDRVYLKDGKVYLEQNVEERDGVMVALDSPVTTEIDIGDFYSYAGQTNWYTTNKIKPTIKAEIPSNIGSVVGSALAENTALRQENAALRQQVAALSEELQVSKILLGVD